jgi:hypothetical protein
MPDIAIVAWGCFVGVVVVVVVNVGVVVGTSISAAVMDVTVPSLPRTDIAARIEASREWVAVSPGRARVWTKVPLTQRARRRR